MPTFLTCTTCITLCYVTLYLYRGRPYVRVMKSGQVRPDSRAASGPPSNPTYIKSVFESFPLKIHIKKTNTLLELNCIPRTDPTPHELELHQSPFWNFPSQNPHKRCCHPENS